MLDAFTILTRGGVVLWSAPKTSNGPPPPNTVLNSLISSVFIEERASTTSYAQGNYTVRWSVANDLGLIFVVVYQSLLQLTWAEELLESVKKVFIRMYGEEIKEGKGQVPQNIDVKFEDFFSRRVKELEADAGATPRSPPPLTGSPFGPRPTKPIDTVSTPVGKDAGAPPTPGTPSVPFMTPDAMKARGLRPAVKGRRSSGRASPAGSESDTGSSKKGKKGRRWGMDGAAEEDDGQTLDFSAPGGEGANGAGEGGDVDVEGLADTTDYGGKLTSGEFMVKELGEDDEDGVSTKAKGALGGAFGYLQGFIGGKTLTSEDLAPALASMQEHLLKKNVAKPVATHLVDSVEKSLVNTTTKSFESIQAAVNGATEQALKRILTPGVGLDLLREISRVNKEKRPYTISFIGVNGVGKSTNLSKVAFWLLQNKLRILVAACDTFRSGAVEQLRVHVKNLTKLSERSGGAVELFERGYGKDAAAIAKDAISYAAQNNFDVVLIDTAGRRHNDARLMSSLEKFAQLARPDKIFMVGEALVGTDSVAQARNFSDALGAGRKLDGFVISKVDTVGDMVGTLVSMVYSTGVPVVFVGVGQMYTDLRVLSVGWAVKMLMDK
ncbi:signal sequence receptor alpha subunit [Saitoella complicata NRRL Y-17804]|uniref:Signal recognition particle receptor subunit alpha homolog n=1 Tax=Saitoella complicata (strain BCRC 22490 / CBS 7301 / JCM 7358 / NBRC 10748 / NRRL Y-17804) TaxID=698492 RepID=A0A0E9ND77_SAICN|nr:signal sequence receptor alpha subunit [Saitoella complicata NRRL Y-17804]ODQ56265.1 signal sequence receptor alpha subunit [Saitoella complicata NRRL Y-17804]GAO47758.1 hypothetical protein G7K_1957-t1 [Saitoella complicata NRRL Y-17804]